MGDYTTEPVRSRAKKIASRLLDVKKEIGYQRPTSDAGKKMQVHDQQSCQDGADMIQKLETEVYRLRQAIGIFHYGRMSEHDLNRIALSWNDDAPASETQETE